MQLIWSIFISAFLVSFTSAIEQHHYYIEQLNGYKCNSIIAQTEADGFVTCGTQCISHPGCFMFSFSSKTGQCVLSDRKFRHVDFFTQDGDWSSGMFDGSVLLLSSQQMDSYMADTLCTDNGMTLATKDDLNKAFGQGYNNCYQGWAYESKYVEFDYGYSVSQDNGCAGQTGVVAVNLGLAMVSSWCVLQGGQFIGSLGHDTVTSAWVLDGPMAKSIA